MGFINFFSESRDPFKIFTFLMLNKKHGGHQKLPFNKYIYPATQ